MIDGASFIDQARVGFAQVFRKFGLQEIDSRVGGKFAELWTANRHRYLVVGMDRRQDYRVYSKIGKTDSAGHPLAKVARPVSSQQVVEFDLEFLLSQSGELPTGFGAFGSGTTTEVAAALKELASAVERYGAPILTADGHRWNQLAAAMLSR